MQSNTATWHGYLHQVQTGTRRWLPRILMRQKPTSGGLDASETYQTGFIDGTSRNPRHFLLGLFIARQKTAQHRRLASGELLRNTFQDTLRHQQKYPSRCLHRNEEKDPPDSQFTHL
jgi:hypothetical protein